jgi:hypothetical protein
MKKILLAVLIIILVLIGYFAYVQWNNIGAVVDGLRLDEEQLQQNTEAVKTEVNDYMKENQLEEIRELTEQEEKALDEGTINDNDAVKIMTGKITLDDVIEKKEQESKNSGKGKNKPQKTEPQPKEEPANYDQLISEKVAQMYVYKSRFLGKLSTLAIDAEDEFHRTFPQSEWTKDNRTKIIMKHLGEAMAMEKDCDSKVSKLVSDLKELLTKAGRDTGLADQIQKAYNDEKKNMKAAYMQEYFSYKKKNTSGTKK